MDILVFMVLVMVCVFVVYVDIVCVFVDVESVFNLWVIGVVGGVFDC